MFARPFEENVLSALFPAHPHFDPIRTVALPALQATLCEYRHRATGARHLHLATDNPENVFLVAFKTMPEDSTGVAHILEHTVLCGSERFPVRDPFFLMIRRSLNTFMNAFTASDWTAYPFASQNRQDFDNLLQVYLDAVFFPHIHPLDFAQEGIRIEPTPNGEALVYKGVVFNEMKGALSSAHSILNESLNKYLFPTTTYHHNSGGDPAHIPDLTHEALKAFHRKHYHPSNAVFMTFGDAMPQDLQTRFVDLALSRFNDVAEPVNGRDEKRYVAPLRVEEAYAPESEDGPQTHHVLAWLLGPAADARARFEAHLLSGVLLENSASPLRQVLETTELGEAPSVLSGLDDNNREMAFAAGIEGSQPEHAAAVEQLILDTLTQVAEQGVQLSEVEAVLHQFELSQREIGGDSYPYGLQLLLNGLTPYLQDADPLSVWDIEAELAHLRQAIQCPDFVPGLVRRLLLDNPHRVRLTLRPDAELAARRDALEASNLAKIHSRLSADELAQLKVQAEALAARQLQENDAAILPKVTLADVPAKLKSLAGEHEVLFAGQPAALPATRYAQGTNGLLYQQLIVDLPNLNARQTQLLPLYTSLFSELGVGAQDYRAIQQRQSAVSGGLRMSLSGRTTLDNKQSAQAHLVINGKALVHHQGAFQQLLKDTFFDLRFDESARVRDLVAQMKTRWEGSITGQGHALAMATAARGCSALAAFQQRHSGLAGIRFFKQLHEQQSQADATDALLAELAGIHALVLQSPRQLLLISEAEALAAVQAEVSSLWADAPVAANSQSMIWTPAEGRVQEAWLTQTQVQFCAKVYPAVPAGHADAPALMALGSFLRNGFLHRAIREQGGAYGGGAAYDGNACAFRFYSYRDPRLAETLADFDASLDWLHSSKHQPDQLEEALLGIFADMDKPLSPSGEARQAFHNQLYGRTVAQRQQLRERLLGLSIPDLQRVAETYLQPAQASVAVVAPSAQRAVTEGLGLETQTL
jgi:Zn-dependent M16 (insulinase) family peptidase